MTAPAVGSKFSVVNVLVARDAFRVGGKVRRRFALLTRRRIDALLGVARFAFDRDVLAGERPARVVVPKLHFREAREVVLFAFVLTVAVPAFILGVLAVVPLFLLEALLDLDVAFEALLGRRPFGVAVRAPGDAAQGSMSLGKLAGTEQVAQLRARGKRKERDQKSEGEKAHGGRFKSSSC